MNKVLFPALKWLILLFIPFAGYGFYFSYFSKLSSGFPLVVHAHAFFMLCWMSTALLQPWLIHLKKTKLHKQVGRMSYLLMPAVVLSTYFMLQYIYQGQLERLGKENTAGLAGLSADAIKAKAADYMIIGLVYFAWLILYYSLAVFHRRRLQYHATYMLGAILTLLGPTFDRALYNFHELLGISFSTVAEYASFILISCLFAGLFFYQRLKGYGPKPSLAALLITGTGIACYKWLPGTRVLSEFVSWMF